METLVSDPPQPNGYPPRKADQVMQNPLMVERNMKSGPSYDAAPPPPPLNNKPMLSNSKHSAPPPVPKARLPSQSRSGSLLPKTPSSSTPPLAAPKPKVASKPKPPPGPKPVSRQSSSVNFAAELATELERTSSRRLSAQEDPQQTMSPGTCAKLPGEAGPKGERKESRASSTSTPPRESRQVTNLPTSTQPVHQRSLSSTTSMDSSTQLQSPMSTQRSMSPGVQPGVPDVQRRTQLSSYSPQPIAGNALRNSTASHSSRGSPHDPNTLSSDAVFTRPSASIPNVADVAGTPQAQLAKCALGAARFRRRTLPPFCEPPAVPTATKPVLPSVDGLPSSPAPPIVLGSSKPSLLKPPKEVEEEEECEEVYDSVNDDVRGEILAKSNANSRQPSQANSLSGSDSGNFIRVSGTTPVNVAPVWPLNTRPTTAGRSSPGTRIKDGDYVLRVSTRGKPEGISRTASPLPSIPPMIQPQPQPPPPPPLVPGEGDGYGDEEDIYDAAEELPPPPEDFLNEGGPVEGGNESGEEFDEIEDDDEWDEDNTYETGDPQPAAQSQPPSTTNPLQTEQEVVVNVGDTKSLGRKGKAELRKSRREEKILEKERKKREELERKLEKLTEKEEMRKRKEEELRQKQQKKLIDQQKKKFKISGSEEVQYTLCAKYTCKEAPDDYLTYRAGEEFEVLVPSAAVKKKVKDGCYLVKRCVDGQYGFVEKLHMVPTNSSGSAAVSPTSSSDIMPQPVQIAPGDDDGEVAEEILEEEPAAIEEDIYEEPELQT